MSKKIFAVLGSVATAAVLATALVASAQTTTVAPTTVTNPPQVLNVNAAGTALLRGTIASISSGVITVNGWGGTWTVNVGTGTQIYPAAANGDISQFKVGDFVGLEGPISTSANWTINATFVRDWTYRAAVIQQRQQNIQTAKGIMGTGPRNYVGTASNVSASSFTLTANGTTYTVDVQSPTEVVEFNWSKMSLTSINTGDNVHVWGVNASGTITAQIVRDVTHPTTSTTQ